MRQARVDRFLQLRQNGRSIRDYSLEFDSLARHAPAIVADMADRVHRYVMGLDRYLIDNCMAMASQPGMDISRVQAYAQGVEDRHRGRQPDRDHDRGQRSRFDSTGYSGSGQSSRVSSSQINRGSRQSRPPLPRCPRCGRSHFGECRFSTGACFTCGRQGHIMRECPFRGNLSGAAQSTGSVVGSSSSVAMRPVGQGIQITAGHGRGRGGSFSSSGPSNRIYALASRQDQKASPNVVTGKANVVADALSRKSMGSLADVQPE
ncbi:uncharacterized protein LOC129875624 [Solanum dulcamara]|uniref:uncharacterized protein LOC129875624 n=1 Tax=Solanum dulcamara TaxID=45834 RepID=UPI0024867523|nr:uncharacterized protein LOC129875624 [Solanum dulcamara]